jgi:hypothetical protein
VIDADTGDVDRRLRQFRASLEQANLAAREDHEAIVHLVPKRSVETWVLCLGGTSVDENTDYSRERGIDGLIPPAAVSLFEWSRVGAAIPPHCVPSLIASLPELNRLT